MAQYNRDNLVHLCPNTGYCSRLLDLWELNRPCQLHPGDVPLKTSFGRKTGVEVREGIVQI